MGCSFIEMKAADVKRLASECLARIAAHKEQEWQNAVAQERKSYERSWWRRLWNSPIPSDEAILATLKGEGRNHFNHLALMIESYGWQSKERAERLLRASELAEVVRVSTEDLEYIGA